MDFIITAGCMAVSGYKIQPSDTYLQIANSLMTNFTGTWWKLLPRWLLRIWGTAATIENFKPSVTGEVLGENRRSYRRGCERRFAFANSGCVHPALLLPCEATVTIFGTGSDVGFFLLIGPSGHDRGNIAPVLTGQEP